MITHRQTGELLGVTGFKPLPSNGLALEVGYILKPQAQGQGYATETLMALASFATGRSIQLLYALVVAGHDDSIRVLEKQGFLLQETRIGEIVLDGELLNDLWFCKPLMSG